MFYCPKNKPEPFLLNTAMYMLLHLLLILIPQSHALCNQMDHDSLLSFSLNVSSSPPLNWVSSFDCCTWEGISCDANGRVTRLSLPHRGLTGTNISPSIGNVTSLLHLNLSHNRLSGPLPYLLFVSLNRLVTVDLSFNIFSGFLPSPFKSGDVQHVDLSSNRFSGAVSSSFLGAALNLAAFNASNNSFSGTIPSICSNSLDFSDNDFSGQIPSDVGKCSQLEVFRAGFNNLSGPLPDDIFSGFTALGVFSLPANSLSGTISDKIGLLTNLSRLELYGNILTGSIPRDIGKLFKLEHLCLHTNNLTGALPPALANCTSLKTLNLRVNSLTGDLSIFHFGSLLHLSILDLGNNDFSGNLPTSLCSCKSLTALRLASNRLEGQILPGMLRLESLSFLSLANNNLSHITTALRILINSKSLKTLIMSKNFVGEKLPDEESIGDGLGKMQVLGLGGCRLTGNLPAWLHKLQSLHVLDLSQNHITGRVPAWLGEFPKLFYLDLSDNLISGIFPKELCGLKALGHREGNDTVEWSYLELPVFVMPNSVTNLQYNKIMSLPPSIHLSNNNLRGSIPAEIGQLESLLVLALNGNNFSGAIPDQLSALTNLEKLDLSVNRLMGPIPEALNGLHFLSSFSVAHNDLEGPVPAGSQFDTFGLDSFDGNPLLCGSVLGRTCGSQQGSPSTRDDEQSGGNISTYLVRGVVVGACFGVVNGFVTGLLAWPWIKFKFGLLLGLGGSK